MPGEAPCKIPTCIPVEELTLLGTLPENLAEVSYDSIGHVDANVAHRASKHSPPLIYLSAAGMRLTEDGRDALRKYRDALSIW